MLNKIIFFDDLKDIFQRGIGYYKNDSEKNYGSIQVAYNDVLGEENSYWRMEFYTLKSTECTDEGILHFINTNAVKEQIDIAIAGADNIFIIMDAYWNESEAVRNEIISCLLEKQDNVYFCIYSTVSTDKIYEVKEELVRRKYSKNIRIFMLDRADSGVLYKQCKRIFENLISIVNDRTLWEETNDLSHR